MICLNSIHGERGAWNIRKGVSLKLLIYIKCGECVAWGTAGLFNVLSHFYELLKKNDPLRNQTTFSPPNAS